jgi:Zn-dependent protease
MAIAWALCFRLLIQDSDPEDFWVHMCRAGVNINLVLMFLNLLPILPLDGGRVLFSLLPNRLAWQYGQLEPYGMLIVIGLLATGVLSVILDPLIELGYSFLRLFL